MIEDENDKKRKLTKRAGFYHKEAGII